jgi:putative transcriptional regulator
VSESIAGRLLVASPYLLDPNFYRTVVYIAEHGPEGALGLVLNRATDEPVDDHVPAWVDELADPPRVFIGGPVSNELAVGLAESPRNAPPGWAPAFAEMGLVDLSAGPEAVGGVARARVFSGYAGWVDGQLEAELATDSWFVVDPWPDDLFTADPERLWSRVLRRQPGRLALYSTFPDDLRSN